MIDDITDSFADMIDLFITFVPKIVGALLLLLIGKFVAGFVRGLVHKLLKALKFDNAVYKSGLGAHV